MCARVCVRGGDPPRTALSPSPLSRKGVGQQKSPYHHGRHKQEPKCKAYPRRIPTRPLDPVRLALQQLLVFLGIIRIAAYGAWADHVSASVYKM